jgi:predicted RNA binding protein YcfA (HicA-like mRNA interferase family)
MPAFGPIKLKAFIACLRRIGFEGPYSGAKHQFMVRGNLRLRLPNPHQSDIGRGLLTRILRDAGLSRSDWEAL